MLPTKTEAERQLAQFRQDSDRLKGLGPARAAIELDHRCPYCNALLIPELRTFDLPLLRNGKRTIYIWPDCHGCPEESAALSDRAIKADVAQTNQQRMASIRTLDRAGLIGWLAEASLDNYAIRQEWPESQAALDRVSAYASALIAGTLGEKKWLILHGDFGMGKSHLAAAVIHEAIKAEWGQVYFRVWPEYLRRLQASWSRTKDDYTGEWIGESEAAITEELQSGKLIVIDDLDKKAPTDWTRSVLFTALNRRYNVGLPTILTFNYGPADADPKAPGRLALASYLGEAILDRLIQSAFDVIEFDGPSYRSGVKW